VATAGFQVEGGFNGPGEPRNNWARAEADGLVEPSGIADDCWRRFEDAFALARGLGLDSFRLSVEWARVEPTEGQLDKAAVRRYVDLLRALRAEGLEPLVTILHFTHPEWLGEQFWLRPDSPERFVGWAERAVGALGEHCRLWVTLNEINILALESYLNGAFPPFRRGDIRAFLRAVDNMLTAHVLATERIHRLDPSAVVSTNNYVISAYELDRLFTDLLLAPAHGVERRDLHDWLAARRRSWYEQLPVPRHRLHRVLERWVRRVLARQMPLERALPRATSAVYGSATNRFLDVLQVDLYDPIAAHHLRLPGHRTAGGRHYGFDRKLWDFVVDPEGLATYASAYARAGAELAEPLELWIVENGITHRVRRGRAWPRLDGWTRPRYLTECLHAFARAAASGVPIGGYWHWTLLDNYEWGSYEPRLGLYGVDRERGCRWLDTDSLGDDAAGSYRDLVARLRAPQAAGRLEHRARALGGKHPSPDDAATP
jgi:beta-glucosidase